ncbi:radical SAM family heme chaperone HemW [Allofrancisella guangzhouensis]|uniref:Heme chaperone HemW n=1 Tax=Allofrancisella guangzhouensis TaxID=594679 RepID=A0A0A8E3Q4_9GAMM|nr:radical SAM family heme chaperone HemW [Allofrancisella guangzhouensis]AJC48252.1 coproporphyrinogen III oxidase [Allofrancisella guangzhouensis]MBK2027520.1 radical SAM family heme chaperone HemW [Allofrancisella guangzhouensis]MBK2043755.1 radical SAM family heme chaperone HemW [Allofrancisella guangzhouensis]MBK2045257.1 radical SAM family heme chaperone HemW [Allofrancisella guangzhouensis]
MSNINSQISIYIHFPWCVRKCPYCDFNSHAIKNNLDLSESYYKKLVADFKYHINDIQDREIISIFIGGGTPSLFKPKYLSKVLEHINSNSKLNKNCEITLEMNPGTVERGSIQSYQEIGINRISLGVQSFQDDKLKALGRIHNCENVYATIEEIHQSKITNFNIDIMHGLPDQSLEDGIFDISQAIAMQSTHISWYQLTIEPNTLFAVKPPILPDETTLEKIEISGKTLLEQAGFKQYEVSAYAKNGLNSTHNTNYWEFGDYIGIGAGAHSKVTDLQTKQIKRVWKHKHPNIYTQADSFIKGQNIIPKNDLIYEFMLNALRLKNGFDLKTFEQQTLLNKNDIHSKLQLGAEKGLLVLSDNYIKPTDKGYLFLNDCINLFV